MQCKFLIFLVLLLFISTELIAQKGADKYGVLPILHKNVIQLHASMPLLNYIDFRSANKDFSEIGFLGVSVGADYRYSEKSYLSTQVGVLLFSGFKETVEDTTGNVYGKNVNTTFVNFQHNHRGGDLGISGFAGKVLTRTHFGYGFSLRRTNIDEELYDKLLKENVTVRYFTVGLGLSFSAYYAIRHYWHLGILYQPQLFPISGRPKFSSSQTVNLDLIFRLPQR